VAQHAPPRREPGAELDPLRTAALGLLYTAPLAGFSSFAMFATLLGEDRLEGDGGAATALGWAAFCLPGAIGACLLAWSRNSARRPRPGVIVAALTLVAGAMLWLVFSGAVDGDGDGLGRGFVLFGAITYGAIAFKVALVINVQRFG